MEFQPVGAEDKEIINRYMKEMQSASCDMSFAAIYLWKEYYKVVYTIVDDMLVLRTPGDNPSFCYPIGKKDPSTVIDKLRAYCKEQGWKLKFYCVSREAEQYLNEHYPDQFTISYNPDVSDYIYDREALVNLKGKKYHGKKNHINKFMKTYEWCYESVNHDNLDECLAMLDTWYEQNRVPGDREKKEEMLACKKALLERDFLELNAGLIRADGNVVAFAVGEPLNDETYVVHFEKAYADVSGAYAIINQQFAMNAADGYPFLNREDDVGEPGLRKAKESYHPVRMEEKGYAVFNA